MNDQSSLTQRREPTLDSVKRDLFGVRKPVSQPDSFTEFSQKNSDLSTSQENSRPSSCQRSRFDLDSSVYRQPRSVSVAERSALVVLVFCLLLIAITFVWPEWFEIQRLEVKRDNGALYLHWRNNKKIYLCGLLTSCILSVVLGASCSCISCLVTYFDSLEPGKIPPSPLSPAKYRKQSGHTYHISYVVSIFNGIAMFFYLLWSNRDYFIIS